MILPGFSESTVSSLALQESIDATIFSLNQLEGPFAVENNDIVRI
jgi:hypothetical protein